MPGWRTYEKRNRKRLFRPLKRPGLKTHGLRALPRWCSLDPACIRSWCCSCHVIMIRGWYLSRPLPLRRRKLHGRSPVVTAPLLLTGQLMILPVREKHRLIRSTSHIYGVWYFQEPKRIRWDLPVSFEAIRWSELFIRDFFTRDIDLKQTGIHYSILIDSLCLTTLRAHSLKRILPTVLLKPGHRIFIHISLTTLRAAATSEQCGFY